VLNLFNNWIEPGWVNSFGRFRGTVTGASSFVNGTSPGFASEAAGDYHLASGSACINAGTALNPAVLPTHDVVRQYVKHQSSVPRIIVGAIDIGAYEY
jgi:hypothetical protein